MNKREFLNELESRLQGLPKSDIDEKVSFYDEMIQDMVEEGKTEEEAIYSLGSIDEIVDQIAGETKITKLVKERIKPKKSISGLTIVLLVIGFPIWLPLLIVFGVLLLLGFILLWTAVIVSYSIEAALIASGFGGLFANLIALFHGEFSIGGFAVSLIAAGLSLVFFAVCIYATKISFRLTASVLLDIKRRMIGGKENA